MSKWTKRRLKAEQAKAATGSKKLTEYWAPKNFPPEGVAVVLESEDSESDSNNEEGKLEAAISALEGATKKAKKGSNPGSTECLRLVVLLSYFRLVRNGQTRKFASTFISEATDKSVYFARF